MLVSIVHDFAVLYSTRVHQKDKKWSDGRFKYYEFNKKIEVVSDSNFLVCSDFYPHNGKPPLESGVFEDGNTYKLPSGKLVVEFSEYLGCTERDISKLFIKSRSSEVVPEKVVKREEAIERITKIKSEGGVKVERIENLLTLGILRVLNSVTSKNVEKQEDLCTQNPVIENVIKLESKDNWNRKLGGVYGEIGVGHGVSGLERPKRTRQVEVTLFVKKLTVEEKLAKLDRTKHRRVRIPVGSNRLTARLHRELGIGDVCKVLPPKVGVFEDQGSGFDDEILEMVEHLKGK